MVPQVHEDTEDWDGFCAGHECELFECCSFADTCQASDCTEEHLRFHEAHTPFCDVADCPLNSDLCCVERPRCSDFHNCTHGFISKHDAPEFCAGHSCTRSECCDARAQCGAADCRASDDRALKSSGLPAFCDGPECTEDECCVALCTESVCHRSTQVLRPGQRRCAGIECEAAECCVPRAECSEHGDECGPGLLPRRPPSRCAGRQC